MAAGKVIDADGHILEPPDLWQRYLEGKYKDRAIRMEKDPDGVEYFVIDGRPSANLRGVGPAVGGIGQPYQEIATSGSFSYFDGPKGAYEPTARLSYMDEEGVDAAAIFPSLGLTWEVEVKEAALAAAYARAYNNWVIDFCSADPRRLIPVAHISLLDIDEGVKEVSGWPSWVSGARSCARLRPARFRTGSRLRPVLGRAARGRHADWLSRLFERILPRPPVEDERVGHRSVESAPRLPFQRGDV